MANCSTFIIGEYTPNLLTSKIDLIIPETAGYRQYVSGNPRRISIVAWRDRKTCPEQPPLRWAHAASTIVGSRSIPWDLHRTWVKNTQRRRSKLGFISCRRCRRKQVLARTICCREAWRPRDAEEPHLKKYLRYLDFSIRVSCR